MKLDVTLQAYDVNTTSVETLTENVSIPVALVASRPSVILAAENEGSLIRASLFTVEISFCDYVGDGTLASSILDISDLKTKVASLEKQIGDTTGEQDTPISQTVIDGLF